MSRRPRHNHSPAFKAKVALDAIRGEKTLIELAKLHEAHPNQSADWKSQLMKKDAGVFGAEWVTADEARHDRCPSVNARLCIGWRA